MRATLSRFIGATGYLMLLIFLSLSSAGFSQNFLEVSDPDFEILRYSSLGYGDYDGDSDLDIILAGRTPSGEDITRMYLNDGDGIFTENLENDFKGVFEGRIKSVDVDADHDLDLIIQGRTNIGGFLKLYLNNGYGQFSEAGETQLPQVLNGDIGVADVNGDTFPDIFVSGGTENGLVSKLFLNNGQGEFMEDLNNLFPGLNGTSVDFGDIDADGDPDMFLNGLTNTNNDYGVLYINNSGIFSEVKESSIPSILAGSTIFVDIDTDGDQDFLETGRNGKGNGLFINNGLGVFEKDPDFSLRTVTRSRFAFGDIDGDSRKDFFFMGSPTFAALYVQDVPGKFSQDNNFPHFEIREGSVAIAQFDGKGLDDILLLGSFKDSGPGLRLFLNNTPVQYPPEVTEVKVTGDLLVGMGLTATYVYEAANEEEDKSTFRWYRSPNKSSVEKMEIPATNATYFQLSSEDENMYLLFEVIPYDGVREGAPVQSEWYGPITRPLPKIQVKGNNQTISTGETNTSPDNHTDFGAIFPGEVFSRTFRVGNSGKATLILNDLVITGEDSNNFRVAKYFYVEELLEGEETDFVIDFVPNERGRKTATVQIVSNDEDSGNFEFVISGNGLNTPPIFLSTDSVTFLENESSLVLDVDATDGDGGELDFGVSYGISGGADRDFFKIDEATGHLSFMHIPDFEDPKDSDRDNRYSVEISADDGGEENNLIVESIEVQILDLDEMPIAVCVAAFTANLDENGKLLITAGEIDNGSTDDSGIVEVSINRSQFTEKDLGENEVVLTVRDGNGNTASCSTVINVLEFYQPLKTKDISVYLDSMGKAIIEFEEVLDTTVDLEEFESYMIFPNTFSCSDRGPNTVLLEVTLKDGSRNNATAVVEVLDNEKPVIDAVNDIKVKSEEGLYGANIELQVPEVKDNCSLNQVTGTRSDGLGLEAIFSIGETTIIWSAHDEAMNSAVSVEQKIIVENNASHGGSVTGGGWFTSPPGALLEDSTITGKASFSISAKYKGGKNNTNQIGGSNTLQFKLGNLDFKSTSIESNSLVTSDGYKATYKGTGTINRKGSFEYIISVVDAQKVSEMSTDLFRMKIWGKSGVIYDTNNGEDTDPITEIGGGAIVVLGAERENSQKKVQSPSLSSAEKQNLLEGITGAEWANLTAFPNPVQGDAKIRFTLNSSDEVTLNLYDLNGRMMTQLFHGPVEAGKEYEVNISSDGFHSGIYICKVYAASGKTFHKQLLIR